MSDFRLILSENGRQIGSIDERTAVHKGCERCGTSVNMLSEGSRRTESRDESPVDLAEKLALERRVLVHVVDIGDRRGGRLIQAFAVSCFVVATVAALLSIVFVDERVLVSAGVHDRMRSDWRGRWSGGGGRSAKRRRANAVV